MVSYSKEDTKHESRAFISSLLTSLHSDATKSGFEISLKMVDVNGKERFVVAKEKIRKETKFRAKNWKQVQVFETTCATLANKCLTNKQVVEWISQWKERKFIQF